MRRKKQRDERIIKVSTWDEFIPALDKKCMVLAPWCDKTACEDSVKDKSSDKKKEAERKAKEKVENDAEKAEDFEPLTGAAKSLCIPFEQPELPEGTKCFNCDMAAKHWVYWGRSF